MAGRTATLCIPLIDRPGQLEQVSRIIAGCGGNVVAVHHDRGDENMAINSCYLTLQLETRDFAHIEEIKNALRSEGFSLI